jgi:hypothetical protein
LTNNTGLTVLEAQLGGQGDAFDVGLTFWLNNDIFNTLAVDLTGTTLTAGPATMFGLDVTLQYFATPGSATMRTLISLQNPTAGAINATATWATNMGSDGSTAVQQTSSLDVSFTTADRWIVTDDSPVGGDPAIVHVLFGPGSPQETPAGVSQTVFLCSGTQGVLANFDVNVPAGQTRYLMFFNQLADTATNAVVNAASYFNNNPSPNNFTAELLTGLSQQQLLNIVNWDFEPPPTPTPTATTTAAPSPTAEPTRVRTNVGGAVAPLAVAAAGQAAENRERAAAAAAPQATVAPPRTGTGVTIEPPSTGDAGLADQPPALLWPLLALGAAFAGAASLALARRR